MPYPRIEESDKFNAETWKRVSMQLRHCHLRRFVSIGKALFHCFQSILMNDQAYTQESIRAIARACGYILCAPHVLTLI